MIEAENNIQEQRPRTSKLAVASFIFSILGIIFLFGKWVSPRIDVLGELIFSYFPDTRYSSARVTLYHFIHPSSVLLVVLSITCSISALIKIKKSDGLLRGSVMAGVGLGVSIGILAEIVSFFLIFYFHIK